jgi:hypothetical protein
MAQVQIKRVRPKHDAILDWILSNPQKSMEECALTFGVTRAWLSVIVNSGVFQQKFQEKNAELFKETVVPLRDKLNGIAHVALERLGEAVATSADENFILAVADKCAHRLGYAPSKGPGEGAQGVTVQQNNFYSVDREMLAEARARMFVGEKTPALEHSSGESLPTQIPLTGELIKGE